MRQRFVHEQMPGYAAHDIEHLLVVNALLLQAANQPISRALRGHTDTLVVAARQVHS
jgi:hypothetical protein